LLGRRMFAANWLRHRQRIHTRMAITAIAATATPAPIPAPTPTPVPPTDEGFAAADADGCEGKGEEDEAFEIVLHPSMLNWLMEELA
jgi:hypothetical protein